MNPILKWSRAILAGRALARHEAHGVAALTLFSTTPSSRTASARRALDLHQSLREPHRMIAATVLVVAGLAVYHPAARAQPTPDYTVFATLHTGQGPTLSTAEQTFQTGQSPFNQLQFAFGFATEEQPAPSTFLDSATITFQTADRTTTLICLTADGNGVAWAPASPGATYLDPTTIQRTQVSFNDQSAPWTYLLAYWVTVPLPSGAAGETANLTLDLFDNGDSRESMAWISQIPEPGIIALMLLGGGAWLARRKVDR